MQYLFNHLKKLHVKFEGRTTLLFLDYDGTISPIRKTPAAAKIQPEVRGLLRKIAKLEDVKTAIISGRSLKDIRNMVKISGIHYAGNHGLEIEGPCIKMANKVGGKTIKAIREFEKLLKRKLGKIQGIIFENKGPTLSIHFRTARAGQIPTIKKTISEVSKIRLGKSALKLEWGKMVAEIKPRLNWNKGHAVSLLIKKFSGRNAQKPSYPTYIGDDTTDENAFKLLRNKGLTIFVGKPSKRFSSRYFLNNTREVYNFLKWVYKVKSL